MALGVKGYTSFGCCPEHGTSVIIMMHAIYVKVFSVDPYLASVHIRLCEHLTSGNLNVVWETLNVTTVLPMNQLRGGAVASQVW